MLEYCSCKTALSVVLTEHTVNSGIF